MNPSDPLAISLCAALDEELRDVRSLIESISTVLVADEELALRFLDMLQNFDLIVQRADESARLLDRLAAGVCTNEAVADVRLEAMQARLRAYLRAA